MKVAAVAVARRKLFIQRPRFRPRPGARPPPSRLSFQGHPFKPATAALAGIRFVQEEEEPRTLQGRKGEERHHLLQQLRRQRAEGQGEEGDHSAQSRRAYPGKGAQGRGSVHRFPHNHKILLHFMQRALRHCQSPSQERETQLVRQLGSPQRLEPSRGILASRGTKNRFTSQFAPGHPLFRNGYVHIQLVCGTGKVMRIPQRTKKGCARCRSRRPGKNFE